MHSLFSRTQHSFLTYWTRTHITDLLALTSRTRTHFSNLHSLLYSNTQKLALDYKIHSFHFSIALISVICTHFSNTLILRKKHSFFTPALFHKLALIFQTCTHCFCIHFSNCTHFSKLQLHLHSFKKFKNALTVWTFLACTHSLL